MVLLLALAGCGGSTSRAVPYEDLTKDAGGLEFTRITRDVFRSADALRAVVQRNNPGRAIRLPAIDFTRREAYLVAAGPRSSTGYDLRIVSVRDTGPHIVVTVHERTPALGDPVRARVTYPFRLIALPASDEPVKLKWPGRP
ncbi:MAG: PrcB C-terminal [Gaiellaceae bacterium]|nr:PrcB C-terminal [Gaiellaceae bacterium]